MSFNKLPISLSVKYKCRVQPFIAHILPKPKYTTLSETLSLLNKHTHHYDDDIREIWVEISKAHSFDTPTVWEITETHL